MKRILLLSSLVLACSEKSAEGAQAAPPGGVELLGRALREMAALLGGRSIAAADFETMDPDIPLGLAARGDEPLVALVGDEQFELAV